MKCRMLSGSSLFSKEPVYGFPVSKGLNIIENKGAWTPLGPKAFGIQSD